MESKNRLILDTNSIFWLYKGDVEKFPDYAKNLIEQSNLFVSPFVSLELQYLYEIKKIFKTPKSIIHALSKEIGLEVLDGDLKNVVEESMILNWTRDPFDRLIVAHAKSLNLKLLTSDRTIRKEYRLAVWDEYK